MQAKTDLFPPALAGLAEAVKALGHPARLDVLRVLASRRTCVCGELVDELPLAQSTVSQRLKVLKGAGLIRGEVDGPRVCYCLDPEALAALRRDLEAFFDALTLDTAPDCC